MDVNPWEWHGGQGEVYCLKSNVEQNVTPQRDTSYAGFIEQILRELPDFFTDFSAENEESSLILSIKKQGPSTEFISKVHIDFGNSNVCSLVPALEE